MPELSATGWESFLTSFPNTHLLQSTRWGELKAAFGWEVVRLSSRNPDIPGEPGIQAPALMGAQILFRRLPLGFAIGYIPRGPVGAGWEALLPEIDSLCRERRAVLLKVEPDVFEDDAERQLHESVLSSFQPSPQTIQPRRTLIVDLDGDDEDILARMKQKTRYNIRLAQRKGIVVRPSGDIALFNELIKVTGERDRFGVHSREYYQKAYDLFYPSGECELLIAEFDGQPLAALMVFARGQRAWYFYGASSEVHRERMPTYLLQWEAMRWGRQHGCTEYDLWGVPDEDDAILEERFTNRSDGLWGVYRFKRGFGGKLCRTIGAWDRVYNPVLYRLYRWYFSGRESLG